MIYIHYDEDNKKIIQAFSEELPNCNRSVAEGIWQEYAIYGIDNLYFDDEGNLTVDLSAAKSYKKMKMNIAFDEEIATGSFESDTLGIEVDCRRSDTKNDYQNVEALLEKMKRDNIESVTYFGANTQTAPATQEQIQALLYEMQDRVLELYNTKWTYKEAISNSKDLDDLKKIEIKYKKEKKAK